jgi:hypothetical protein
VVVEPEITGAAEAEAGTAEELEVEAPASANPEVWAVAPAAATGSTGVWFSGMLIMRCVMWIVVDKRIRSLFEKKVDKIDKDGVV